jgi:hypothetical protein
MGELYPRQPLERFRLTVVDGQVINRGDLTDEQLREMIEGMHRQVILDSNIIEVSDGFSNEIGIDPLRDGFAIESEFAGGRTNTQIFLSEVLQPEGMNIEWLRYSHRTGRWVGETIADPKLTTRDEQEALITVGPTERRVPWLPPGTRMREAGDGKLIVVVNPVILSDEGTVRRPPPSTDTPRTEIILPKLADSQPRTEISTPDNGTILIGGRRGPDGDGAPRGRSRFQIDLTAGYTGVNLPTIGTGTLIDGPNETFLVESPEFLHGFNVGGRFTMPLDVVWSPEATTSDTEPQPIRGLGQRRGHQSFIYIDGNYINASGDEHTIIEPGTLATGITSNTIDTPAMTTGIGFGATGADATMDVEFDEFNLEVGGGWRSPVCGCHCTSLTIEPHANFRWINTDVTSRISNITFTDNFADLNQQVDEYVFGAGIRASLEHRFNRKLSVLGSIDLGAYYYNAEGDSNQSFTFPIVGPPNDDFSVIQDGDTDGFGITAGFEAGLEYRLSHNFRLSGIGGVKWNSDQAYWRNPQNPLGEVAGLDSDDSFEVVARLQLSYSF